MSDKSEIKFEVEVMITHSAGGETIDLGYTRLRPGGGSETELSYDEACYWMSRVAKLDPDNTVIMRRVGGEQ